MARLDSGNNAAENIGILVETGCHFIALEALDEYFAVNPLRHIGIYTDINFYGICQHFLIAPLLITATLSIAETALTAVGVHGRRRADQERDIQEGALLGFKEVLPGLSFKLVAAGHYNSGCRPVDPLLYKYRCMIEDLSGEMLSEFEGIQIPIPQNAEKILRFIYGDYMSLPKIENYEGSTHEALIVNPEKGYKTFFSEAVDKQMLWDASMKKLVTVK